MNEATMAQNPFLTRYLQATGVLLPQAVDEYLELQRQWKTPRCSRPLHTDSSHRSKRSASYPVSKERLVSLLPSVSELRKLFESGQIYNMNRRERLSRRVDAMADEENVRPRVFTRPVPEGEGSTRRAAASPTSACVDHTNGFGQKRETEKGPETREAAREPDDRSQQVASTPGDAESRAERIARYKAERRRQLAEKYGGSESARTRGPDAVETGSEPPRGARSRARESHVRRSSDDNEATLATSTAGLSSRRGQHLPSLDIDSKVNDSAAGEIALQEDAVRTNRHGRVIPHDADPAGGESLLENYTSTAKYYYRRSPGGGERRVPASLMTSNQSEMEPNLTFEQKPSDARQPVARSHSLEPSQSSLRRPSAQLVGDTDPKVNTSPSVNAPILDSPSRSHSELSASPCPDLLSAERRLLRSHHSLSDGFQEQSRREPEGPWRQERVRLDGRDFTPKEEAHKLFHGKVISGETPSKTNLRMRNFENSSWSGRRMTESDSLQSRTSGGQIKQICCEPFERCGASRRHDTQPHSKLAVMRQQSQPIADPASNYTSSHSTRITPRRDQWLRRTTSLSNDLPSCSDDASGLWANEVEWPRFRPASAEGSPAFVKIGVEQEGEGCTKGEWGDSSPLDTRISVSKLRRLFAAANARVTDSPSSGGSNVARSPRSPRGAERRSSERFRTQPITSAEREDSARSRPFIGLDGSEGEEDKVDDKAKMSVAEKRSLFRELERTSVELGASPSGKPRSRNAAVERRLRRNQERSRTQPVDYNPVSRNDVSTMMEGVDGEDDTSRLSLVQKMALFNQPSKPLQPQLFSRQEPEVSNRRTNLRYQTQPITAREVQQGLSQRKLEEAGGHDERRPGVAAATDHHGSRRLGEHDGSLSLGKPPLDSVGAARTRPPLGRPVPLASGESEGTPALSMVTRNTSTSPWRRSPSLGSGEWTPGMERSGELRCAKGASPPSREGVRADRASNQELSGGDGGVGEEEEKEDISQLSLVEKMALFDRLSRPLPAQQASPCQASDTRSRRTGSRYQTQPITASEVQQIQDGAASGSVSEGGPGQWTEAVEQNFSQGSVQLVTQESSKLGRPRSFSAGQEVTEASSNNNSSSNVTRTAGERELRGDDMPGTTLSVFQSTFKEKTQMEQETIKTLLSGKLHHDHGRLGDTKQLETVTIDNPKSFSGQHLTRDQSEKATTKQSTVTQTENSERKMKSEVAARHKEDEAGQVKQSEYSVEATEESLASDNQLGVDRDDRRDGLEHRDRSQGGGEWRGGDGRSEDGRRLGNRATDADSPTQGRALPGHDFSDQTSHTRETVGDTSPSGMATAPWRQTRLQQVINDKQQLSSQSELISGSKTNTPSGGSNAIGNKSELPTTPNLMTTMSIKDRLSSLQKSGNEDWKNRSNKRSGDMKITRTELFKKAGYPSAPESDAGAGTSQLLGPVFASVFNPALFAIHQNKYAIHYDKARASYVVLEVESQAHKAHRPWRRQKLGLEADSKMSISERKALISESEMAWQVRGAGAANDSVQFTVAGRMVKKGLVSSLPDPLTPRSKAAESAISKPDTEIIPSDSIESDKKLDKLESFLDRINTKCTLESRTAVVSVTEEVVKEVLQPDDDETFRRFYSSSTSSVAVEIREEDLDVLCDSEAPRLLSAMSEHRRSVRPARRTTASRNPIKALAQRNDIKTEYTEQRLNVATIEANRLRAQKLAKHSRLADAALAGLASKEDFSSVNLRSVATASPSSNNSALPYKPVMLLQVKGRRHVQTRLVEPRAISLNSGDCFLLLTHQHCYLWIGEFANVIEKAKASDLATYIQTKRDLGCRASSITIIEEGINCSSNRARSFWDLLGGRVSYKGTGPPEEDELYENDVVATNCAFRLQGERLVPDDECWGKVPRCTMLNPCDVVVFDFGSEVYVWHGKEVTLAQRKVAFQLAKQLWVGPYDYNTCRINPLGSDIPRMGEGRPEWSIFGRLTQHNETVLFKEKFLDWADVMKPPKKNGDELKEGDSQSPHISSITTTSPTSPMATIENMVHASPEGGGVVVVQPQAGGTVLEGVDVGRGHGTVKGEDARAFELSTVAVEAWHVAEHGYSSVAATSRGQLHMGDAYIVKWKYMLCPAVSKRKKSEAVRSVTAGRERCAYFFWQGRNAGVSDKGASALMTIELDTEKGPQVPVQQGKEPPCFVQLFQGGMIVHRGRREELDNSQGMTRLFCVRGELVEEALLLEVVCGPAALRSRASLLLLEPLRHVLTVWHGCCCPPSSRRVARHTAKRLRDVCPPEMNIPGTTTLSLEECEEGAEPSSFWNALGGHDRMAYQSLLQDKGREGDSLKLYRTSSASGELVLVECTSNVSVPGAPSAMPFLQDDLYGVEQPALFVLQTSREAYVWQGWWPVDRESTGSSRMRWDTDRRAAMEAALLLHKESSGKVKGTAAYLVYAGLEPPSFTNLFPCWESHPDVAASSQQNTEVREKCTLLEDALAQLSQTTYSLAQLTTRPLPPGVDPLKLERYLSDVDFQSVLNMSREEYHSIPLWKQATLKKEVGLF
ncbi:supervillin isoform X3 [Petromyzon marinus]|uniref:supervillin isoform X3 n=1 Tax=Petromyzon marinus TaxID=7757 RepID=UPI003F6F255B